MKKIIHYLPRVLAIIITLFFGVFILEGWGDGFGWKDTIVNSLATLVLASMTFVAWKHPRVGGGIFIIAGFFFGLFFHPLFWIGGTIGGITMVTGILFWLDSFSDNLLRSKIQIVLGVIVSIGLILGFSYLIIFGRALKQSENHWGIIRVLPEAIFYSTAVRIDNDKWLAKNTTAFIKAMEYNGYTYKDQMGSGYFLEKNGINYFSSGQMYSAHFMVFTNPTIVNQTFDNSNINNNYQITKTTNNQCSSDNDCELPFEYAIRSSCPYQNKCLSSLCTIVCFTYPDPQWLKIRQAISDCQVKSLMQTHDLEVTAQLKDGQKVKAIEPSIDLVFQLVAAVENKCGKIQMATE